ncbi:MAG: DEAD/DEAH box helicase, partial [Planctomycetaceae bacterium]
RSLMNQGHIELDQLEVFVLDEADRMLDMGFLPDLKRIISKLPDRRQSLFFSATMPPKIVELSQRLLRDPVSVNVTPESTSVEKIEQRVLYVDRKGKQELLQKILKGGEVERALVFTKTKRGANLLADQLLRHGIKATAIHGNKSQAARQRALEAFRRNQVQVLVATDVAARGIDIDGISHVVNFDLPVEPEGYVHRIGRTGRAGAAGVALTFCCPGEGRELRAIEQFIGQKVPVAAEHPQPEAREPRSVPQSHGRRGAAPPRQAPDGADRQRRAARGSDGASAEGVQPRSRRRPRRKGVQRRQRANQVN